MKKPTVLPTLEGSEEHLSIWTKIALAILCILAIGMLLAPWSN